MTTEYIDCTPEQMAFWDEVSSWAINPLKYATPRGFEININRQELSFFDTAIMQDSNLSVKEAILMINICSFYPTDFCFVANTDIGCPAIQGLDNIEEVANILKGLQNKGYISLDSKK